MRHPFEQSMVSMWTVMEPYKILMMSAVGPSWRGRGRNWGGEKKELGRGRRGRNGGGDGGMTGDDLLFANSTGGQ